jgi:hypothetical protein
MNLIQANVIPCYGFAGLQPLIAGVSTPTSAMQASLFRYQGNQPPYKPDGDVGIEVAAISSIRDPI